MCVNEIERSIDLSAGLNFIYLVGNRYGSLYVPLQIDEDEFESIIDVARDENLPNLDLIKKWFQLDKNSLPPKYVYVVSDSFFTKEFIIVHHFLASNNLLQTFRRTISRKKAMACGREISTQSTARCSR